MTDYEHVNTKPCDRCSAIIKSALQHDDANVTNAEAVHDDDDPVWVDGIRIPRTHVYVGYADRVVVYEAEPASMLLVVQGIEGTISLKPPRKPN